MHSEKDTAAWIAAYEQVRRSNDSAALGRMWAPDGTLHHPDLSRPIPGSQLPAYNDDILRRLPDITWELLRWASRDDIVYLEWTCRATISGTPLVWSGVDRMVIHDGLITEEVVYYDTVPLWITRDPLMRRAARVDADLLGPEHG
ncbi:MAG: nuclear transport factor 2 family protein [Kutzneria sp.]|nr:nuclear transport factor 2 family protein [Kutzneria sp.]